jgi:hypothetical protein
MKHPRGESGTAATKSVNLNDFFSVQKIVGKEVN